jgi:hypothetical protein
MGGQSVRLVDEQSSQSTLPLFACKPSSIQIEWLFVLFHGESLLWEQSFPLWITNIITPKLD